MDDSGISQPQGLTSEGLCSVRDAASFLGLSRSTIYSLMEQGHLAFVKLGRSRRIPRRALVALAEANLQGGHNLTKAMTGD